MARFSTKGIFDLLERLNMRFPQASGGLADKVRYDEKVNFILSKGNGKEIRGKNK